jgi:hypothetical protein
MKWEKITFFLQVKKAIAGIFQQLDHSFCQTCERRIFQECQTIELTR